HDELRDLLGARDVGEHLAHRPHLALGVGVGGVDDVEDDVGLGDLLQRGAERLDELVGQVADEADGVGEGVDPPVGGLGPAPICTTSSGISSVPGMSASTSRTARSWPSGSGWEASTTWRMTSASATSSSVERNASTSSWGRLRTKPTVSARV